MCVRVREGVLESASVFARVGVDFVKSTSVCVRECERVCARV